MPQKHGAQLSKRQKTALTNQKKQISTALDDEEAFFGRVIKINMGRAVVNIWDHEKRRHIEVQARLPNKKKGFIKLNDLVNIAKSHPDWEVQIALDAKAASQLRKAGRISAEIATEMSASSISGGKGIPSTEDLGIEFDYDGLADAEADEEALAVIREEKEDADAEVDVDAI